MIVSDTGIQFGLRDLNRSPGIVACDARRIPHLRMVVTMLLVCATLATEAFAATNSELVPGSRLVFPYFDLRPGFGTLLIITNIGPAAATVTLEFYDTACARQNAILGLSAGDTDLIDLSRVVSPNLTGSFQQGFVDAVTNDDVLLGSAVVSNGGDDWAVAYPAAPARRLSSGTTPFQPYPTRLFLPAFLTPGSLGSGGVVDGLLVLAAPHPTRPGAELPPQPIQPAFQVFRDKDTRNTSASSVPAIGGPGPEVQEPLGHHAILPIGHLAGLTGSPAWGWLSVTNLAVDETGSPIGLVGVYLQTSIGPDGSSATAVRLWADPSATPAP
ncbi:MAG TPA: hypothetical protein VJK02_03890 [Anaerolineales bacterium]|nr:hypothetical protein [Anaerolineales bacterium]